MRRQTAYQDMIYLSGHKPRISFWEGVIGETNDSFLSFFLSFFLLDTLLLLSPHPYTTKSIFFLDSFKRAKTYDYEQNKHPKQNQKKLVCKCVVVVVMRTKQNKNKKKQWTLKREICSTQKYMDLQMHEDLLPVWNGKRMTRFFRQRWWW